MPTLLGIFRPELIKATFVPTAPFLKARELNAVVDLALRRTFHIHDARWADAVARASAMINSSRPVIDAKLAFFELLMACFLWRSLGKSKFPAENRKPKRLALPCRVSKISGASPDAGERNARLALTSADRPPCRSRP